LSGQAALVCGADADRQRTFLRRRRRSAARDTSDLLPLRQRRRRLRGDGGSGLRLRRTGRVGPRQGHAGVQRRAVLQAAWRLRLRLRPRRARVVLPLRAFASHRPGDPAGPTRPEGTADRRTRQGGEQRRLGASPLRYQGEAALRQVGHPGCLPVPLGGVSPPAQAVAPRRARPHHLIAAGGKVTLDGSGSGSAGGTIARYEWTFQDGSTAEGATVERTYPRPGSYSEILKVSDAEGRIDYDFAIVQVLAKDPNTKVPPTIHASYAPTFDIHVGDPVTFKVRTFRAEIGNETWDFGDRSEPVRVRSDGNAKPHNPKG